LNTPYKYSEVPGDIGESFSFSNRVSEIHTMSDAFACATKLCDVHDYRNFLIAELPPTEDRVKIDDIVLTNLPRHMMEDLLTTQLLSNWAVFQELQHTSAPFSWSINRGIGPAFQPAKYFHEQKTSTLSRADIVLVKELEIKSAHCFQSPNRSQHRTAVVLLSGSKPERPIKFSVIVSFQLLLARIECLKYQQCQKSSSDLTTREIECLRWAAAGKTSGEMAAIIGLSEHTVNHYLISCCKKLDCVNRTQAVAKSIRLSII